MKLLTARKNISDEATFTYSTESIFNKMNINFMYALLRLDEYGNEKISNTFAQCITIVLQEIYVHTLVDQVKAVGLVEHSENDISEMSLNDISVDRF